jgi:hypothetical protein
MCRAEPTAPRGALNQKGRLNERPSIFRSVQAAFSARKIVASPTSYSRASSAMVSPAA